MQHPVLRNPILLRRYALAGVPLLALLMVAADVPDDFGLAERLALALPFGLSLPFLGLGYWFVARAHPAHDTSLLELVSVHGAAAAVGTLIWIGLGTGVVALVGHLPGLHAEVTAGVQGNRALLVTVGLSTYAVLVLVYSLLIAMERQQTLRLREEELVNLAKDAELRALKLQLNPHFLFNALNSISALTTSAPDRARSMCVGLGDFLRHTLTVGERRAVPLGEELTLARDYLALERVRFGERLVVHEDVGEGCEQVLVPPLVLQPLLENAVKHGLGSLLGEMHLRLAARRREGRLELMVRNDLDPSGSHAAPGTGLGLVNTRERVHRFAPREGTVGTLGTDTDFTVTLTLPWETLP